MLRRFLLVSILCFSASVAVLAQRGAGGTSGSSGGTTASSGPAGAPGTTAQGGLPSTAGTMGGLSGQAASGPLNSPSGNTGIPTVQQTMGGPAGTTGTNQGDQIGRASCRERVWIWAAGGRREGDHEREVSRLRRGFEWSVEDDEIRT